MARVSTASSGSEARPFQGVGFALSSLGFAVAGRFRETLAPLGLEPKDFALLRAIAAAEGSSQNALGSQLHIPPSPRVAFADTLQGRGLLKRRPQPGDRRAHALFLTDAGRALMDEAFALAVAFERELTAVLSAADRKQLLALLGAV